MALPSNTIWPFAPNWRQKYTVSFEFKTDIFTSRSGKEQRRSARVYPRKGVKFSIVRANDEMRAFNRFMKMGHGSQIRLPELARFARSTAAHLVGATEMTIDRDAADWLTLGASVVLDTSDGYLLRTVDTYDSETLTVIFNEESETIIPAGSKLHPALPVRMPDSIDVKMHTSRAVEGEMEFEAQPGLTLPEDPGFPSEVFNRREVFPFRPNFSGALSGSFNLPRDKVDFGTGRIANFYPVAFSQRTRQFNVVFPTYERRRAGVQFFLRQRGRAGEFYLPSWEDDFVVAETAAAGDLTLTLVGPEVHDTYESDDVFRAIIIRQPNGTEFYRRITAAALDGANSVITTDVGWPVTIDDTVEVQWLVVNRFAVDLLDLECISDSAAVAQFSVTSLEDLPVGDDDNALQGLDGAAEWVLENWGMSFFETNIHDQFQHIVNDYPVDP